MTVTKKQLALLVKRSPAAITKWIAKGLPILASGAVDFERGRAWAERNIAGFPGVGSPGVAAPIGGNGNHANGIHTDNADTSYAAAAKEKLIVQTERERIKLQRERRVLIPESEFMAVTIGALAWFCAERRVLPARLRDELAGKSGPECELLVARELEACQRELCRRLRVPSSDADDLGAAWLDFPAFTPGVWAMTHAGDTGRMTCSKRRSTCSGVGR